MGKIVLQLKYGRFISEPFYQNNIEISAEVFLDLVKWRQEYDGVIIAKFFVKPK